MERLLIPLLASSLIAGCSSQLEIRGRTEPGIISMRYYEERGDQAPILPAHIVLVDKYFEEPNGNQALDAEETGYLVLQLRNDGLGEGKVSVRLTPLGRMEHLQMKRHIDFGFISVQEEKMLRIPIQAGTDVAEGNREMRVEVIDEYSLSTVPFTFSFNTHSLEVPEFRVVVRDYDDGRFYAGNKTDGLIAAGELVKVTANVQNLGGNAEGVEIEVDVGDSPNFRYTRNLEENTDNRFFLGDLARGDHGDVEFYFFTTPVFSDSVVKIQLNITEDRNRFGVTEELAFDIGQSLRTEEVLAVKSVTMKSGSLSPVLSAIVDVEQVPQHSKTKLENGIAIIVGIEEYKYTFDAAYKNRDAAFFYRYCREVLGISEDRILLRTDSDATKAEFDYVFEPKDTLTRDG